MTVDKKEVANALGEWIIKVIDEDKITTLEKIAVLPGVAKVYFEACKSLHI